MNYMARDAIQASQSFVLSQITHVEQQMWEVKYPDITYQSLVPVDTTANPWSKSITFFSMDGRGKAEWFNSAARDVPLVGLNREQFESAVHMAAIGYDWHIEEINQARMLGQNLQNDKAKLARRAYEEKCESVAFLGDTTKGLTGLINASTPARADVPDGASTDPQWSTKTPDEILADVNAAITGVWITTKTVAMADTMLLPLAQYALIATKRIDAHASTTILSWIEQNNIYTKVTGQKLTIRAMRQLAGAGNSGTDRMVVYRRSPEVLKMHIPMPLQFLAPQQEIYRWLVPGMFRIGGTDIRLPSEIRYYDSI